MYSSRYQVINGLLLTNYVSLFIAAYKNTYFKFLHEVFLHLFKHVLLSP